ncbi:MAG TPA: hypothetical protein V6D17_13470, partial [Candidatus Obscuribacterales bacterium]
HPTLWQEHPRIPPFGDNNPTRHRLGRTSPSPLFGKSIPASHRFARTSRTISTFFPKRLRIQINWPSPRNDPVGILSDFLTQLQAVEEAIKHAALGVKAKFDTWTFKMLIGCLKSEDPPAVLVAIDQLVKEKRPISIPPLYVVYKAHPNQAVRNRALVALTQLDPDKDFEKLTEGKEMKEAVKILVERFGNFKEM